MTPDCPLVDATPLDRSTVLPIARSALRERLDYQRWQHGDPLHGAGLDPTTLIDLPGHTGTGPLIGLAVVVGLEDQNGAVLERAEAAVDYLLRVQRPSGRIDLRDCNYDSGPDTAFLVQQLVPVLLRLRDQAPEHGMVGKLERFLRLAATGLVDGGVHTPNHRWVLASGLAGCQHAFPELDLHHEIDRWLAETIDIDDEGWYLERSAGGYDAVCDRSLLLLHDWHGFHDGLTLAARNLHFNRHLLHPDGSIEGGLSSRWDRDHHRVAMHLLPSYLTVGAALRDQDLLATAAWLWARRQADWHEPGNAFWLAEACLWRPPVALPQPPATIGDGGWWFPRAGLWRHRRDGCSASLFRNDHRIASLSFGAAQLHAVRASETYLGHGRFVPETMAVADQTVRQDYAGRLEPYRLGYAQALGEPVPMEDWDRRNEDRHLRAMPPCASTMTWRPLDDGPGLAGHWRTAGAIDRVTAQIAFDFPPGGLWEHAGCATTTSAGQVIVLKAGEGRMRFGPDSIAIGPGANAFNALKLRDTPAAPDHVRVVIPLLTPIDHHFQLRCIHGV